MRILRTVHYVKALMIERVCSCRRLNIIRGRRYVAQLRRYVAKKT